MKSTRSELQDLILDIAPHSPGAALPPMQLLDAPKIEPEEQKPRFNWKPTIVIVAVGGAALLAAAYL